MPPIVDANVILRYLLNDIPEQAQTAREVIDEGCETTIEVLAEVVYVLARVYRVPRGVIANELKRLLDIVYVSRHAEAIAALSLFEERSLDFVDCVLAAQHSVAGRRVVTFDKKLARLVETEPR